MPDKTEILNKTWMLYAPWAHPIFKHYAVMLVDLYTPTPQPPTLFAPDMKYEVLVYCLDPQFSQMYPHGEVAGSMVQELTSDIGQTPLLSPPNHVYQFFAPTDDAAVDRIKSIADMIDQQRLSPDTDFVRAWDEIFADGKSARDPDVRSKAAVTVAFPKDVPGADQEA